LASHRRCLSAGSGFSGALRSRGAWACRTPDQVHLSSQANKVVDDASDARIGLTPHGALSMLKTSTASGSSRTPVSASKPSRRCFTCRRSNSTKGSARPSTMPPGPLGSFALRQQQRLCVYSLVHHLSWLGTATDRACAQIHHHQRCYQCVAGARTAGTPQPADHQSAAGAAFNTGWRWCSPQLAWQEALITAP
jgi:hypothetical protein